MAQMQITFRVHIAWWLKPYVYGLAVYYGITGRQPDLERIKRRIERAITVKAA